MTPKLQEDSTAVLAELVLPYQANTAGNVHGGEIIKLMDSTAGVAAQKHCHTNVVTARIDELCFKKPVMIGEYVTCRARVVYTGNSSMEVFVTVESEDLRSGKTQIALTAFFTMVSLDENGRPSKVPPIDPGQDTYSQRLHKEGEKRYLASKKRRKTENNPSEEVYNARKNKY